MKTDVFRGKQLITLTTEGGSPTVTVGDVALGSVTLSSVLNIGDSFYGLLESEDKTQWELSECTLISTAPDVYSRALIDSSTYEMGEGGLYATCASFTDTATLSSVAVGGSFLPNKLGIIDFNGAIFSNFAIPQEAANGYNVGAGDTHFDISSRRFASITLYGSPSPFYFTNAAILGGAEIKILFQQDATGSRTVTYAGNFHAIGGTQTLNGAANATTLATYITLDDGASWYYHYIK